MTNLLTNIIVSCISTSVVSADIQHPAGTKVTNLQQVVTYQSTNGTSRPIMKLHGCYDWWIVDYIDTNYPVILKR